MRAIGTTFSYTKIIIISLMTGLVWSLFHFFVLREYTPFTFVESLVLTAIFLLFLLYTRRTAAQTFENLELILQQMPTGVIIAESPTGKLVLKNHRAEEILHMTMPRNASIEEYSHIYQGYHADGSMIQNHEWPLARAITSGEVVRGEEITFTDGHGNTSILQLNAAPIYDCHKKIVAGVLAFSDISNEKINEHLLSESLDRYRTLIDTVDGIVWESDANFTFTFVSQEAERLTGFSREEWMQENFWAEHLHPEDKEEAIAFCVEQCAKLLPHDFEYRFITKEGKTIWLRDLVSIVMTDGKFTGLRGIMVDISDKIITQEKLHQSESRLKTILENEPEGIIILDQKGIILESNPGGLELCGVKTNEEIISKNFIDCVTPAYKDVIQDMLYKVVQGEKCRIEFELSKTKSWLEVQAVPLPDHVQSGMQVLMVARDATEKKQLDIARDELLSSERIARLGAEKSIQMRDDFLSVASHELKTPLTPIKLEIQLVKQYLQFADKENVPKFDLIMKHLTDADRQFDRFLKLVANLLDVSLISADRLVLEPENVDLSHLLLDVCRSFAHEFEVNGVTLTTHIENGVVGDFDKIRMEQVVVNLLSNALKYGRGKPVELSLNRLDGKINLSVKDQGIGIAKPDQTKLFEKFERIAPVKNYPGLGLGLYITNNIVKAHHGEIKVVSEAGHGTSFIVEIPLHLQNLNQH
jgi:PAS domain S-box-containing protein